MRYHKLKAGAEPGMYIMESRHVTEDDILTMAKQLSRKRLSKGRLVANSQDVKDHLQTLLQDYQYEVFAVLLLDTRHRVIGFYELFRGTIDTATVYPREVAKLALEHNAAAIIMTHNHPSGDPTPSVSDINLTKHLQKALDLIKVNILDHIVVSASGSVSLAEKGEM